MQAIAITPGVGMPHLVDRPEPTVSSPDELKVEVVRVGIYGTDREEARGGRSLVPAGQADLVIGHEMMGRVVEIGSNVTRAKPGDWCVFTVRRGCGKCIPCLMGRSDMCLTGTYLERGIWGMDGYQSRFVVDKEQYVVRVPPELADVGVLAEPLSVAEKAIDETVRIQEARLPDAGARPHFLYGRRCLVAGLGPIGLLAAMALRLRGADVYGLDVVDGDSARPAWLRKIGGFYIDGRQVPVDKVDDHVGPMEFILEATGVASLEFNLLDALGTNGAYVLTGVPGGNRPLNIAGDELIRRLVLGNQMMVGSVNAARDHFQLAIEDLADAYRRWGDHVTALITERHAFTDAPRAIEVHSEDAIKEVVEWS